MTDDPRLAELLRRAREDRPPPVDVERAVMDAVAATHPGPAAPVLSLPANLPVLATVAATLVAALTTATLAWPLVSALLDPLGGVFTLTELALP